MDLDVLWCEWDPVCLLYTSYYATKDQIYTIALGDSQNVTAESRYTVDRDRDGEITSLTMWRGEYGRMNVSLSLIHI